MTDFFADISAFQASVLAVTVSSLYLGWTLLTRHYGSKKPFADLPMPPGNHWLFGHVRFLDGDIMVENKHLYVDHANKDGQTGFWFLNTRCLSVLDWKDAKAILHAEYYRDKVPLVYKHFIRTFGEKTVIWLAGREWKVHRAFILRAFNPSSIERYRQTMVDTASVLVNSLQEKMKNEATSELKLPLEPWMKMVSMDVFGKAGMSTNFNCCEKLESSEYANAFDFLNNELIRRIAQPLYPPNYFYSIPTPMNNKHKKCYNYVRNQASEFLKKRKGTGQAHNDMLADILDKSKSSGESDTNGFELTEEMAIDSLTSLVFAGYDTTSISLCYSLYLLSQHPEAEAECLKEIASMSNKTDYDSLVYCQAVTTESLRLFPSGPATSRSMQKPLKLPNGFVIPEGTFIQIPIFFIQRDERNFACPNDFRPDRWVKYDEKKKCWVEREGTEEEAGMSIPAGNRDAMFAFSTGGRSCPGYKFAQQEAALVLSVLLPALHFEATPGYKLKPVLNGITQKPSGRLPMIIKPRVSEG